MGGSTAGATINYQWPSESNAWLASQRDHGLASGQRVVRVALSTAAVIEWSLGVCCGSSPVPTCSSDGTTCNGPEESVPPKHRRQDTTDGCFVALETVQLVAPSSLRFTESGSVFGSAIGRDWCCSKRAADEISPTIAARMRKNRIEDVPKMQIKKPRSDCSA